MIDKDEYPQTAELEMRCVNMLSRLWNSPRPTRRPDARPRAPARPPCSRSRPQAPLAAEEARGRGEHRAAQHGHGINVQICWEKFCNYFEVEPRYVPMEGNRFHLNGEEAVKLCDENTIGVVAILGSTSTALRTGQGDLGRPRRSAGAHRPRRADPRGRGFGGMVAPFRSGPSGTSAAAVASINTSPQVRQGLPWGWLGHLARPEALPKTSCSGGTLGGDMPTRALDFSRPGSQIVAQYYNFLGSASRATGASSRSAGTSPPTGPPPSRSSVPSS